MRRDSVRAIVFGTTVRLEGVAPFPRLPVPLPDKATVLVYQLEEYGINQ